MSCARALSRATLARRGWGHWSSNARCDHRDRRSFSSSSSLKILCPLVGLDLVSFVFARRARYSSISLSLSRSLDQERDHLYYQKGIRPRRRRSLSKVSKRLSRGVVVASPPHSKRYRPISLAFSRAFDTALSSFPFYAPRDNFGSNPKSESNRTRFCFRRSRTQNGKNNDSFSPFQSQQKPPL